MSQISLSQLKKALAGKSTKELIEEIAFVHKSYPAVKNYFTSKYGEGEGAVIEQYRELIKDEFFPKRGYGKLRLAKAKKAISDFKKISTSPEMVIDLMLFYVEQGVKFTDEYGDINEKFYCSIERVFEDTTKLISKNKLTEKFRSRCSWIVKNACSGWAFQEGLEWSYQKHLGQEYYHNTNFSD